MKEAIDKDGTQQILQTGIVKMIKRHGEDESNEV